MAKIGFIVDSSGDLPLSYYFDKNDVIMLPLLVRLGIEAFTDWYDISPELSEEERRYTIEEFYNEMKVSKYIPYTIPITVHQFIKAYKELAKNCDVIISLHFSQHLGYTVKAAEIAASKFKGCKVIVIDTLQISNGYGAIIKEAISKRDNGASLEELVKLINNMVESIDGKLIMTNKTYRYLYRCGRMNLLTVIFASLLGLKSFTIKKGKVTPNFKYRGIKGFNKAFEDSIEAVKNATKIGKKAYFIVSYTNNEIDIVPIIQRLKEEKIEYEKRYLGLITGVYSGPGTYTFMPVIIG